MNADSNVIFGTDPAKFLARKRSGKWWLWLPHDQLPVAEFPTFNDIQWPLERS